MTGYTPYVAAMPEVFEGAPSLGPVVEFIVRGLPAPQGSKRHVGNGVLIESSSKVKPWRADVKAAAETALEAFPGWRPLDTPVQVTIGFWLPRPKSQPRTRRTLPGTRPDLDKLTRSTLDALDMAGVYTDDSRVTDLIVRKRYVNPENLFEAGEMVTPGASIRVEGATP